MGIIWGLYVNIRIPTKQPGFCGFLAGLSGSGSDVDEWIEKCSASDLAGWVEMAVEMIRNDVTDCKL